MSISKFKKEHIVTSVVAVHCTKRSITTLTRSRMPGGAKFIPGKVFPELRSCDISGNAPLALETR